MSVARAAARLAGTVAGTLAVSVVFVLAQRWMISGLTAGGIKG